MNLLNNVLVLDSETTGICKKDQVIQLSVLKLNHNPVFNEYLNTEAEIHPKAQEVHGITKEMLSNKKSILDHADDLVSILKDKVLMGYNVKFDIDRINASGALYLYEEAKLEELITSDKTFAFMHQHGLSVPYKSSIDLMAAFAAHNAEWIETKKCWKNKKLSFALDAFGISSYFQDGDWHELTELHNSLADTRATIELFFSLLTYADVTAWGNTPVHELFDMTKVAFEGEVASIRLE